MEVQIATLTCAEGADALQHRAVDTHPYQRGDIGDGRDEQAAAVVEADQAAVEQGIGIGGEQLAVLAVGALFVAGVATGFAVAGDEKFESVDANAGIGLGAPYFLS